MSDEGDAIADLTVERRLSSDTRDPIANAYHQHRPRAQLAVLVRAVSNHPTIEAL